MRELPGYVWRHWHLANRTSRRPDIPKYHTGNNLLYSSDLYIVVAVYSVALHSFPPLRTDVLVVNIFPSHMFSIFEHKNESGTVHNCGWRAAPGVKRVVKFRHHAYTSPALSALWSKFCRKSCFARTHFTLNASVRSSSSQCAFPCASSLLSKLPSL